MNAIFEIAPLQADKLAGREPAASFVAEESGAEAPGHAAAPSYQMGCIICPRWGSDPSTGRLSFSIMQNFHRRYHPISSTLRKTGNVKEVGAVELAALLGVGPGGTVAQRAR